MNYRSNTTMLAVSAVIGALLGYIGGPVQILVIWGVAGLVLGYLSRSAKSALLYGFVFGFIVSYVFMLHGYGGTASIYSRLVPFAALGLFGAACGCILTTAGYWVRRLLP